MKTMHRLASFALLILALTSLVSAHQASDNSNALVQAVEQARSTNDDSQLLAALNELAATQAKCGEVALARENYEGARQCAVRMDDASGQIQASKGVSRIYRSLGQYGDAIEQLSTALDVARDAEAESSITELLHEIGKVYADAGDPLRACEFQEQALLRMEKANTPGLYRILLNLAVAQSQLGEYELAISHYKRARELAEQAIDGPDGHSAGISAGIANIALGDELRGIEFILSSADLYRTQNDKSKLCAALVLLGVAYEGSGQDAKALIAYEEAARVSFEIQNPGLEINARLSLARLHAARGDFEAAYSEGEQYLETDRKRATLEQQASLAKFRATFEAREQLLAIEELEDEARLGDSRIKRTLQQRTWLAVFASAILMALASLALLSISRHKVYTKLGTTSRAVGAQRDKLEEALARAAALRGQLPICNSCNNIQDEAGAWLQLESFVTSQTGAKFTHGICPDCVETNFPQ